MYERVRRLISPLSVKRMLPLYVNKASFDEKVRKSISGNGNFLLIIGPCSADNPSAVLKFCEFLAQMAREVEDKILIVPRVYTAKPRSAVNAYRGLMHSPNAKNNNISKGLIAARKLMVDIANQFMLFSADELLYPQMYPYFDDVLSYVTLGARSSEDQYHKMMASGLDIAVGVKNAMYGNLKNLAQAVKTVGSQNDFMYGGYEVLSSGNKSAHAILRGYTDNSGKMYENYSIKNIIEYSGYCDELGISDAVIVDCNHFNSGKNYLLEPDVALETVKARAEGRKNIIGLMIESYLLDGNQSEPTEFGKSITDGCLGLKKTEKLIYQIAEKL